MPIDRLPAAALILAALAAGPISAQQDYPRRAITIIAPFSPGTGIDILARTCGQKLSQRWGVPVVVDNKPGASGNIGTELAARAAGDGYTLMMTATAFALNPALSKKSRYDPLKSFTPVSLIATGVLSFAINANTPAADIGQFVALAKSNPGKSNYPPPATEPRSTLRWNCLSSRPPQPSLTCRIKARRKRRRILREDMSMR